jgi:uncharacterized protein YeaO (DUF488 family)
VKKTDYARLDYFDTWLPDLAPSADLVKRTHAEPQTPDSWSRFADRYRREMRAPAAQRLIGVLAVLSRQADFSLGCYCEDESRCHRSLLRELLTDAGATIKA